VYAVATQLPPKLLDENPWSRGGTFPDGAIEFSGVRHCWSVTPTADEPCDVDRPVDAARRRTINAHDTYHFAAGALVVGHLPGDLTGEPAVASPREPYEQWQEATL
jgi:hypothetical protein